MDENKNIRTLVEEDDGEEIVGKKVTLEDIEAKEKEEEEQAKPVLTKEEQKLKDKKSNKLTAIIIGSIVGIVVIAGIIVTVTKPKFIRDLPFNTDGKTAADLNDVDYQDGDWYLANQQNYGFMVKVTDICNVYDKPTARGNSILTLNTDDTVMALADVYDSKKKEPIEWCYIKAGDIKGYLRTDYITITYAYEPEYEFVEQEEQEKEDEDRKEFYAEKLVESMAKNNQKAKDSAAQTQHYMDVYYKLQRLNRQLDASIVYMEDEEGNEIEVPYEYTPEELESLVQERDKVAEELAQIQADMEIYATDDEEPEE